MTVRVQASMRPAATAEEAAHRLDHVLGDQAVVTHTGDEAIVAPLTEHACARALSICAQHGWRTGVCGRGGWSREGVSCTVRISLRRFDRIACVRPSDLYATVGAGVTFEDLASELAGHGMWLPVDPPGTVRTVGSVLASATQGALGTGFGGIRDHVLGLTVLTGNGRILRLGGRVVKNVAGFDLAKLAIGGFGAYGLITAAHVKLRTVPARDVTIQATGARRRLLQLAADILHAGLAPAALELAEAEPDWELTARVIGSGTHAEARVAALNEVCDDAFGELGGEAAPRRWSTAGAAAVSAPTTIRIGTTLASAEATLELTDPIPGRRTLIFRYGGATLRWTGHTNADDLSRMRTVAAESSMPVVIERGPAAILTRLGHFGALDGGARRLARSVQRVFDPSGILCAPIWGS